LKNKFLLNCSLATGAIILTIKRTAALLLILKDAVNVHQIATPSRSAQVISKNASTATGIIEP